MFQCLFLLMILLQSCGGNSSQRVVRIGVDSDWYPMDFGLQAPCVNGFTGEILLEVARHLGMEFERVDANWDVLYENMKEKKYEAVLGSLPPYDFNKAQYDFSSNFLDLGPILVVPVDLKVASLEEMKGKHVGIVSGDPAFLILQKHPDIIPSAYQSISQLLESVVSGEIEGALLNRIPAVNYVSDRFAEQLKIATEPLNDEGLHLVTLKGKSPHLITEFNRSIDFLKKKKKIAKLLEKWELSEGR